MKAFNKEVANKIYTLLTFMSKPEYARYRSRPYFFKELFYHPADWDLPEFDKDFVGALELWEKEANGG